MHNTMRTCQQLLNEYITANSSKKSSKKIKFLLHKDDQRDVYNITAPFSWQGETLIAGRVEARDSEQSEVIFFRETLEGYVPAIDYPILQLQDPCVTIIKDEIVIGGVEIFPDPNQPDTLSYRTIFYRGNTFHQLKRFANGPDRMKDIRLLALPNDKILVAVRPQGALGGRGKIGFLLLNSMDELNEAAINNAQIIEKQFISEEWGGCNEMHLLDDGKVGILSHIACFDEAGDRHYYSTCFTYQPYTGECSPMKMIAARKDFPSGAAKRPDLVDVIFSGGLIRTKNGNAVLYCGVSDAEAHCLTIEDPFL